MFRKHPKEYFIIIKIKYKYNRGVLKIKDSSLGKEKLERENAAILCLRKKQIKKEIPAFETGSHRRGMKPLIKLSTSFKLVSTRLHCIR